MTTEEKKIEEAARDIVTDLIDSGEYDCRFSIAKDAAIELAKSDAAKEYHTKGMFTQQQLSIQFCNGYDKGVEETEKKMITKEEVLSFFEKYEPNLAVTILKSEFVEWFDKIKTV